MKINCTLLFVLLGFAGLAQKITGTVKDEQGNPLAFASVFIKNTTRGTTANDKGFFSF
ncbi:MAG: carboxypeptidase-like regulatory domain-containing protein, partial [Dinghuibacter sp.]|nr:carboxypeptidase-like regulatory domain-containing protein [Dinghuibacter sp.]